MNIFFPIGKQAGRQAIFGAGAWLKIYSQGFGLFFIS
jgi:hypothetical protein